MARIHLAGGPRTPRNTAENTPKTAAYAIENITYIGKFSLSADLVYVERIYRLEKPSLHAVYIARTRVVHRRTSPRTPLHRRNIGRTPPGHRRCTSDNASARRRSRLSTTYTALHTGVSRRAQAMSTHVRAVHGRASTCFATITADVTHKHEARKPT